MSILASLLVSLTVTPVLSYYLLPQSKATHRHQDGLLLRWLKWAASYLIRFSMRQAGVLLLLTWVLVGFSAWQLTRLGADFLPKFDEGSVQINVALPGGSSLKASNDVSDVIDRKLATMQKSPENPNGPILHFARRTGRAELDEHAQPVNVGEYILTMNPDAGTRRDEFLKTVLADLRAEVPGVEIEAEQPLSHLISHMLSGVNAQVAVKIFGDDLDKLRQLAGEVRTALAEVPGVTPPIIDPQERVDELHVVLRPDDLALYGISREFVADFVQTALKGEAVSKVLEGQRRFDLVIKLQEPYRSDPDFLKELRLELPDGRGQLRLKDVADFPEAASGPNLVNRENVRRKQVVRCNVTGRDLAGAIDGNRAEGQTARPTARGILHRVRRAVRGPAVGHAADHGLGRRLDRRHLRRADDALSVGPHHVSDSQRHSDGVHRRRAGPGADRADADGGQPRRLRFAGRDRRAQRHPAGDALLPPDEGGRRRLSRRR